MAFNSGSAISRESAETIALKALGWMAQQDDILMTFLGATGASLSDLRAGAGQPEFLASVLGFLGNEDDWIRAFCDAEGLSYDKPLQAMAVLAGPSMTHWT